MYKWYIVLKLNFYWEPVGKMTGQEFKYLHPIKEMTSIAVFNEFIEYDAQGNCNASGILSKECYQKWLESRKKKPKCPPKAFRRALTAHVRGVDGRRPFEVRAERSLLRELRKKKIWACFEGDPESYIGIQGFPSSSYHEKIQAKGRENIMNDADWNAAETVSTTLVKKIGNCGRSSTDSNIGVTENSYGPKPLQMKQALPPNFQNGLKLPQEQIEIKKLSQEQIHLKRLQERQLIQKSQKQQEYQNSLLSQRRLFEEKQPKAKKTKREDKQKRKEILTEMKSDSYHIIQVNLCTVAV
uniref:Uncharacterized protein n=1 Tax=Aplanochytrium stocchinoi TaxID=215587 RepID=A0A7S3LJ95_9STRA